MTSHRPPTPPEKRRRRRYTDLERLRQKYIVNTITGCWEWTAYTTPLGYGQFYFEGRRNNFAHRAAYKMLVGPIPAGLTLDHLCRNRRCCNPEHLEPVTLVENVMRGESFYAQNARATICPEGHPLTGSNLYLRPDRKGRDCRTCRNNRTPRGTVWEEKRQRVRESLFAHPEWTDLKHAAACEVNPKTVSKVRHNTPVRSRRDYLADIDEAAA